MTADQMKIGFIKTSKKELGDIIKAWMVLSLAFAVVYTGAAVFAQGLGKIVSLNFILMFFVSLVTAGLGFLLHELAHKFVAQHYGCVAEFRAFDQMLYLALGLALLVGFIFAAPGAVMIAGRVTTKENGLISLAGPLMNYILGMIFLMLLSLLPGYNLGGVNPFQVGFFINLWLGLFNLLPFGHFDGKKILYWNRWVWLAMAAFGVYFIFF